MLLVPAIFAVAIFGFSTAQAQDTSANKTKIVFPIVELGGCDSATACRTYCNDLNNVEACSTFGRNHGLITAFQAEANLKFKEFKTGPGGCTSKEACRTYCENTANTDECVAFAKEHKLADTAEIEKFRKFQVALKNGETPGDCTSKEACRTYCEDATNAEECTKFAEDKGLVEKERAAQIRKFNIAIKTGETPGDCTSRDTCKTYCEDQANRTECADFASKQGLINAEETRKLKEGAVGPGGCDSKQSCETFCENTANQQTCLDFATQRKIMNTDEAGIRMKLEREKALLRAREIKSDDSATEPETSKPSNALVLPSAVRECVTKNFGADLAERIQKGEAGPVAEIRVKIARCLSVTAPKTRVEPKPELDVAPQDVNANSSGGNGVSGTVPEPFNSQQ